MLKTIVTAAAITILALADAPLQTGQVKSYDADGTVVTDGSIKDDGYYRAGKARSYGRSGNVVTDNATGLEWQDNETIQKPWLTQANYDVGDYFNTLGDTATTYCTNLPPNGEWRLPSIEELQTLVNYSQHHPAVTEGIFSYISSLDYWSSTTSATSAHAAWYVYFYNGYSDYSYKAKSNYVRCVRGGQLGPSNLSRNDTTKIVTDTATGLQWQDDTIVETTERSWTEAIDYCENTLTLGGHSDWRLPNSNELFSIVEYSQYSPAINTLVFLHTATGASYYWSSTTDADIASSAWYTDFRYGALELNAKGNSSYVRCVRGGQVNIPVNPSVIMYLLD